MYTVSYEGHGRKVLWQELWRHEFEDILTRDPVVILPTGPVEQHGPHCPMDVDIAGPFHMAVAAAQRVDDFPVLVAPPIWSGFTHYNWVPGHQALLADGERDEASQRSAGHPGSPVGHIRSTRSVTVVGRNTAHVTGRSPRWPEFDRLKDGRQACWRGSSRPCSGWFSAAP